jgi:hypothetical protein
VDVPGYKSPSIITGDTYRPDLLLSTSTGTLYIVELTVGFESNLQKNVERKKSKYKELIREQNEHFNSVKFVNLSISSLGVFGKECSTFIEMLIDFGFQKQHQNYCIRRMTTIANCNPNNLLYILLSKQGMDESGTVNCLNAVL